MFLLLSNLPHICMGRICSLLLPLNRRRPGPIYIPRSMARGSSTRGREGERPDESKGPFSTFTRGLMGNQSMRSPCSRNARSRRVEGFKAPEMEDRIYLRFAHMTWGILSLKTRINPWVKFDVVAFTTATARLVMITRKSEQWIDGV